MKCTDWYGFGLESDCVSDPFYYKSLHKMDQTEKIMYLLSKRRTTFTINTCMKCNDWYGFGLDSDCVSDPFEYKSLYGMDQSENVSDSNSDRFYLNPCTKRMFFGLTPLGLLKF